MDAKDRIIRELKRQLAEQELRLAAQRDAIENLLREVAELKLKLAKANKDSSTSSKPPSSDIVKPPGKKRPRGRPKKRKKGAQAGHDRKLRKPLPPERVDETIEYGIDEGEVRRLGLTPTGDFDIIQHVELPESPVHVTEYRLAVYRDADGNLYIPDCPELKGPIFGPRLLATIGWLKSMAHCSYSTIEAWMEDVLQVPVSRGYLSMIRDIRFLEKHPDKRTKAWADRLLDRTRRMFSAWHRRDEMTADGFNRSMLTHRDRFLQIVRNPPSTREAANLAGRFATVDYVDPESSQTRQYDLSQDYFRFMFVEGVEPTNNHTEQQVRQCVIDRLITQGTRGLVGHRYHERMWTAIATCKKQCRNFFSFLRESIAAHLQNRQAPSLLHG